MKVTKWPRELVHMVLDGTFDTSSMTKAAQPMMWYPAAVAVS